MKSFVFYNTDPHKGEPPPDTYLLFENYCCDKKCDCRKVMINFVGKNSGKIFETISYGWEDLSYYVKWLLGN